MIRAMTKKQKEVFCLLTAIVGVIDNHLSILELNKLETKRAKTASTHAKKLTDSFAKRLSPEMARELVSDMKSTEIFCMPKKEARQKWQNEPETVTVKKEAIDILAEYALHGCNKDCDRNHKACKLKRIFRELEVPELDPEAQGCKYKDLREE